VGLYTEGLFQAARASGTCPSEGCVWAQAAGARPLRVEDSGANFKRPPASGRAAGGAGVHPAM
jgi:hypothetical protein